jgi:hypothetical protein
VHMYVVSGVSLHFMYIRSMYSLRAISSPMTLLIRNFSSLLLSSSRSSPFAVLLQKLSGPSTISISDPPAYITFNPAFLDPGTLGKPFRISTRSRPLYTRSRSEHPSIFNMNRQQEMDLLGVGAQFNNNDASAIMAHHQAYVYERACRTDQADLLNSDQDMYSSSPNAGRHGNTPEQ